MAVIVALAATVAALPSLRKLRSRCASPSMRTQASPRKVAPTRTLLSKEAGFTHERITAEEIRNGMLNNFDVVIFPGGSGSSKAAPWAKKAARR